jgi:glycerol uptake facilitator-like aquaporin
MGPLPRRLLAEFVGTIFLVGFGAGAIVTALQAGNGTLPFAGLGFVALAFGLAIAVAIYAFGRRRALTSIRR